LKIRYNFENTNDKEGKKDFNSKRAGRNKEEEEEEVERKLRGLP
jgi:hypothetical protein